jgi:hypothetical protein
MQPQYAYQTSPMNMPMMPTYNKGGDVEQTYGLRNAAEMLRERGRGDDTVLAHITPEEAGILKLLGGSGTINPHTGLPEYGKLSKAWKDITKPIKQAPILGDIYKVGSSIGKELERGVERIAQNKYLGPIAQMASYLHPVSAALYAGLAPEGSSFDVKGAAKAAAMQQIMSGVKEYAMGTPADGGIGIGSDGASMSDLPYSGSGGPGNFGPGAFDADIGLDAMSGGPGTAPPIGAVESAVTSAGPQAINYPPDPNSYLSGAPSYGEFASAPINAPVTDSGLGSLPEVTPERLPTASEQYFDNMANQPSSPANYSGEPGAGPDTVSGGISPDTRSALRQGIDTVKQGYADIKQGIGSLTEPITKPITDLADEILPGGYRDVLSTAKDVALVGGAASTAYSAYEMKKELEKQKEEADRILRDQENKKAEEIAWAQGVIRDYPFNYRRLTAEEVASERGMAMGGRINSYDDEIGGDDGMMQGGIAALAKGGLPPRYLRGGGDGMSDSIKANIDGKQEARLADGEFVIPADVVSHLGNGSSNAGAKKLYAMMNRIRKSRTGKTRQAPEVNTRRLMPA